MKRVRQLLLLFAICTVSLLQAQNVGINTTTPDASAALDVTSTTQGVLVPRMTQTQRTLIATPAAGLLVYQTDGTAGFYFYNGSSWTLLGATGPQGPAGPQGVPGPTGMIGATGPQGPIGLTGAQGATGLTGPQGPIGATGAAGPQGAPGPAGMIGDIGPQGPIGLTGATGAPGPQGLQGSTGPVGPQGPIGLNGATGLQGPIGLTGEIGPQGPVGETGATGATGNDGATGATGPQGAVGPQGPIGLTGSTGPQGTVGPQGSTGLTGPAGANGNDGATGPQGPIGLTGDIGPQGPVGATGSDGAPGAPGPQGLAGPQGATGATGTFQGGTTAGEMIYWNGAAWVTVAPTVNQGATLQMISGVPTWVGGTPPPPPPGSVTNPTTGKIWLDRNLGATQVATSSSDPASFGDLYQWGRGTDGHQLRTSGTTITLSSVDQPGHGNWIIAASGNHDWRSPQNVNLWQGINGVNNPCPISYRLPTETELEAERLSWISNNPAGAFASPLKLPMAGIRSDLDGTVFGGGSFGSIWSSTISGIDALRLVWSGNPAGMDPDSRALGVSVRCIKE